MNEAKIISTIASSREALNKLTPFVEANTFSDNGQLIYKAILEYYAKDKDAVKADLDIISSKLKAKTGKKYDLVHEYIQALPEPGSVPNILSLFNEHLKEKKGLEIIQAISLKKEQQVGKLMEEFLTIDVQEQEEEVFHAKPLEELEQQFTGKNLIPIYPSKLNELLGGGVPRQYQVGILARPNVGKSTTAINIAGGAAKNGYKVLYCGNEDPAAVIAYRLVSRILGKPEWEIKKDLRKHYEDAMANGYGNIILLPMHPGTLQEIRGAVEKYTPDIVIIDQLRNLHINGGEGITHILEQGSIGMRNLAKEFNFVSVVVTQAGESASNKLVLEMEDVEWSNTGFAAQMDLMIAMGQNEEFRMNSKVMLSFPKRKYGAPIKSFHAKIDYERNTILA